MTAHCSTSAPLPHSRPSSTTLIARAATATDAAEMRLRTALQFLDADRFCNGFGLYTDRATVRSNLVRAKEELEAAIAAISIDWPRLLDYEQT